MTDKPQVKEYKEALEKLNADSRALAKHIEYIIALRDAEWNEENIVVIARSGEVLRGACGIDELKSALDKLTYTQADNYRSIRESK